MIRARSHQSSAIECNQVQSSKQGGALAERETKKANLSLCGVGSSHDKYELTAASFLLLN